MGHAADRARLRGGEGQDLKRDDTIVAIATPPGRGGVGIVRLSGPAALRIGETITRRRLLTRRAALCSFRSVDGVLLDSGLAFAFAGPASFTGEDIVELHAHGSPIVLDELVATALGHGARLADPGEFSLRAFLNGRVDLAQAEAIADLIDAGTAAAARAAAGSLTGTFSRDVHALKARLIEVRVIAEACIDFPEEDLELTDDHGLRERVAALARDVGQLSSEAAKSAELTRSPRVVIAGAPNAGKSSLLNKLTGRDAAIVTAIPGTTRDVIRERLDLAGVAIELVDTAGLRGTDDLVEAEGVRRARAEIEAADLVLHVVDATAPTDDDTASLPEARQGTLRIVNKIDLTGAPSGERDGTVYLSAESGDGLEALGAVLHARLVGADHAPRFLARRRHVDGLRRCVAALSAAEGWLAAPLRLELAAEELALAQRCLGELVGDVTSDELLGHIFSTFCIGK